MPMVLDLDVIKRRSPSVSFAASNQPRLIGTFQTADSRVHLYLNVNYDLVERRIAGVPIYRNPVVRRMPEFEELEAGTLALAPLDSFVATKPRKGVFIYHQPTPKRWRRPEEGMRLDLDVRYDGVDSNVPTVRIVEETETTLVKLKKARRHQDPGPGQYDVTPMMDGGAPLFLKAPRFSLTAGSEACNPKEGDILELDVRDDILHRSVGTVDMSKTSARKAPRVADHVNASYDPSDEYLRPHVAGPLLEKLGRPADRTKADPHSTLEYDPNYELVEPAPRTVDFTLAQGHKPMAATKEGEGDKLTLEPQYDVVKPRVTAPVDLHRQQGRKESTAGKESARLEYDINYDAQLTHVPGTRLDTGGRPAEMSKSLDEGGYLKYDPDYDGVRASAPAAHFAAEIGHGLVRKDGEEAAPPEPQEGDILELDVRDDILHRSVGTVDMSKTSARKAPRVADHVNASYDPSDEYLRPHVAGPLLEKLGRPADRTKADPHSTLEYDPNYELVEPAPRTVDFTLAQGHKPMAATKEGEGDKLTLEPQYDVVKPRVTAPVDLHRQQGRKESTAGKESARLEYDINYDAQLTHVPGTRLDTGGRPAEMSKSLDEGGYLKYDPDYDGVRASAPAAHFAAEIGHGLVRKDGEEAAPPEPQEGDILELHPTLKLVRRSAPSAFFTSAPLPQPVEPITVGCDHHPDFALVKPRAPAAEFSKLVGRDEEDLDEDAAARPLYFPDMTAVTPRTVSAVPFARQVGRDDLEKEIEEDDVAYEPQWGQVQPRLTGGVNMHRQFGRDEDDAVEDDREYSQVEAAELFMQRHVASTNLGVVGRDSESQEEDERDYEPDDAAVKPRLLTFSFDKRIGHAALTPDADDDESAGPDGLEYDPNYDLVRRQARSVDFSAAAGRDAREPEVDDRSFFLPRDGLAFSADAPPGGGALPLSRQVGREELETEEELDDRSALDILRADAHTMARLDRGHVAMERHVGREELELDPPEFAPGDETEDESLAYKLLPGGEAPRDWTRRRVHGFSMRGQVGRQAAAGLLSQSVDAGLYYAEAADGLLSTRERPLAAAFGRALLGQRTAALHPTGPAPAPSPDTVAAAEAAAAQEAVKAAAARGPRSILRPAPPSVAASIDTGMLEKLSQAMPRELAERMLRDMQEIRGRTTKLRGELSTHSKEVQTVGRQQAKLMQRQNKVSQADEAARRQTPAPRTAPPEPGPRAQDSAAPTAGPAPRRRIRTRKVKLLPSPTAQAQGGAPAPAAPRARTVRFADEPATRRRDDAEGGGGGAKAPRSAMRRGGKDKLENVRLFEQQPHERDLSWVRQAGPGRRALRQRALERDDEAA